MDKKKIILISSIALILTIAIICVVIFGKDKSSSKSNNETTSKVTEVTSTETDTETNSEKETESTTEVESTTEEITTEEPTTVEQPTEKPVEKPTVDPFTIEPSGKYAEKQELVDGAFTFYLRTYENGAKEHVVYVSIVNKYYKVAEVGVVPENVLLDISTILQENYEKQEQQAQQQQQTSKPQQQQQTTSKPASSNKEEETTSSKSPFDNWGENQSDDWYNPDSDILIGN